VYFELFYPLNTPMPSRAPRGGGHSFYPHSIFLTSVQRAKLRRGMPVQLHRDSARKATDHEGRIVHLTHTQLGMLHRAWSKGKSHRIRFSQRQLEHNARMHMRHGRGIFDSLKNAFSKAKNFVSGHAAKAKDIYNAVSSHPLAGKVLHAAENKAKAYALAKGHEYRNKALAKGYEKVAQWENPTLRNLGKTALSEIQSRTGGRVRGHKKHHKRRGGNIPDGSGVPSEFDNHVIGKGMKGRKGKGLFDFLGLGIQAPGGEYSGGAIPDGSGVPAYGHAFGKGISAPGGRVGHKQ